MATLAHVLDPLIEPDYASTDKLYERAFKRLSDDGKGRDYLRGYRKGTAYVLEWVGDKLLVSSSDRDSHRNNALRLYDVEHDEEESSFSGEFMCMQADPGHPKVVAAAGWNGRFLVFDTRVEVKHIFDVDLKNVSSSMKEFLHMCWAPNSQYIALGNRQDGVFLLDLRQPGRLMTGQQRQMPYEVNQMVWSADGDALWIATGGSPGRVHIFPAPSLSTEGAATVVAHQYAAISIAADREGRQIATGGGDCLVTLWDPKHLVCTRTFGYATQPVTSVGFNCDGNLLAWGTGGSGGGGERNLTIVGTNTGVLHWQDQTQSPVVCVKWHPNNNVLAYSLRVPDEDFVRRPSGREAALIHFMKIPDLS